MRGKGRAGVGVGAGVGVWVWVRVWVRVGIRVIAPSCGERGARRTTHAAGMEPWTRQPCAM